MKLSRAPWDDGVVRTARNLLLTLALVAAFVWIWRPGVANADPSPPTDASYAVDCPPGSGGDCVATCYCWANYGTQYADWQQDWWIAYNYNGQQGIKEGTVQIPGVDAPAHQGCDFTWASDAGICSGMKTALDQDNPPVLQNGRWYVEVDLMGPSGLPMLGGCTGQPSGCPAGTYTVPDAATVGWYGYDFAE